MAPAQGRRAQIEKRKHFLAEVELKLRLQELPGDMVERFALELQYEISQLLQVERPSNIYRTRKY